jgi:hypothetical protein
MFARNQSRKLERERAAAEKGASFLGRRERFMRKMNGEKEESKSERRMRARQDSLAASSLSSTLRCRAFCCCQTGINNKSAWLCKCERPSARSSYSAIWVPWPGVKNENVLRCSRFIHSLIGVHCAGSNDNTDMRQHF